MKNFNTKISLLLISILFLIFSSCDIEQQNPNAATENEVLNTKEGILSLCVGMKYKYSKEVFSNLLPMSALTSREIALGSHNELTKEFQEGGKNGISNDNPWLENIWKHLLSVKIMAEKVKNNVHHVNIENETKNWVIAYSNFFYAISIGNLYQHFEYVPFGIDENDNALFVDRKLALEEAVRFLEDGILLIKDTSIPENFKDIIGNDFDLQNSIYLYLSRYHLFLGNYQNVIDNANQVNKLSKSIFTYDSENINPIFSTGIGESPFAFPVDSFGLTSDIKMDDGDCRMDFYMSFLPDSAVESNIPIDKMKGFFDEANKSIPVYLTGEIDLNKAEAYARLNQLNEAVEHINLVRTKNDDTFGVNANLTAWEGDINNQEAILKEIYKNRCIELFLQALRLEDARRFSRPEPPLLYDFSSERNRNFYPYPASERDNNTNTPNDPEI